MDGHFLSFISGLKCYDLLYPFQRHRSFLSNSGKTGGLCGVKRKSSTYGMQSPALVDSMWKRHSSRRLTSW
jgi:hypothetical protein